ncbi:hypothetical protein MKEN_00416800 [Mycena kentingensis (nom. inval.)]|nr:hypothetical protein MKEN_00416800 [Mycena kentingensis (nom. inval.)]
MQFSRQGKLEAVRANASQMGSVQVASTHNPPPNHDHGPGKSGVQLAIPPSDALKDSFRLLLSNTASSSKQPTQKSRSRSFLPSTSTSKAGTVSSSEPAFKPRKVKQHEDGKYRNRAAERRAGEGNDYAQVEAVLEDLERRQGPDRPVTDDQRRILGGDGEHSILVKGLDFALLAQNKAKAAANGVDDDSLEQAYQGASSTETPAAPAAGKKRTRDDIIRELKEKKAGGSGAAKQADAPDGAKQGMFRPIGFKPIGGADEKKRKKNSGDGERKKKKRKVDASEAVDTSAPMNAAAQPAAALVPPPPVEEEPLDDDFDIFAGEAEYKGLDDDEDDDAEDNARAAARAPSPMLSNAPGKRGWFDDDEPPPPEAPSAAKAGALPKSPPRPTEHDDEMDAGEDQPIRLVPLASSAMPSIKDFLSMGDESTSKKKKKGKKKKKAGKGGEDDDDE